MFESKNRSRCIRFSAAQAIKIMIIGIIVLIMGVILILQALGVVMGNFWGLFWGLLFVVIGVKIITKRKKGCWHCEMFGNHNHSNNSSTSNEN